MSLAHGCSSNEACKSESGSSYTRPPHSSTENLYGSQAGGTSRLDEVEGKPAAISLREKQQHPFIRNIRHRLWMVYQRLFTFIFLANASVFIWFCYRHSQDIGVVGLSQIAIPIAVLLFATLLFRTEYWINFLYTIVIYTPHWVPLAVRRRLAKVYEFGGMHSGAGVSSCLWAILFTVQITRAYVEHVPHINAASVIFAYLLLSLLGVIIIAAHPAIRRAQHDYFEMIHRFCGWVALAFFWILAMLLSHSVSKATDRPMAVVVFTSPVFFLLLAATFLTVLPWLRLRNVSCYAEKLSNHAVRLYFPSPRVGSVEGIRISTNPLYEWHSFAAIPCTKASSVPFTDNLLLPIASAALGAGPQFSVLMSRAGDWTAANITQPRLLRRYWIRGVPVRGVALVVRLFRRAVVVTTGSGIGPALSMLSGRGPDQTPCRLVWSTKDPLSTYGAGVLQEVYGADPHALVWDTSRNGRPDMLALAWQAYTEFEAEAVICISNPVLTQQVVYGLESRGVPAYGPVFDS